MSCLRCGGMLGVELAAAMNNLVCEREIIEGPHCHCDEINRPMQVCALREQAASPKGLPDEQVTSERRTS